MLSCIFAIIITEQTGSRIWKTASGRPAFQGIHRLCAGVPWARGSFSRRNGAVMRLVILAEEPLEKWLSCNLHAP